MIRSKHLAFTIALVVLSSATAHAQNDKNLTPEQERKVELLKNKHRRQDEIRSKIGYTKPIVNDEDNRWSIYPLGTTGNYGILAGDADILLPLNSEKISKLGSWQNVVMAKYMKNGKWGVLANNSLPILDVIFDNIISLKEHYIHVEQAGERFYVDLKSGDKVKEPISSIPAIPKKMTEGLVRTVKNGKYGFVDANGKMVIPAEYDYAKDFNNGVAIVKKDKETFYINKANTFIIPATTSDYSAVYGFSEGFAVANNAQYKYGFIDKKGNVVIPFTYDDASEFKNGLARVEQNGKDAFINTNNEIVIPFETYDGVYPSVGANGLINVKKGNQYGYADANGKMVIAAQYDFVAPFGTEGLALVGKINQSDNEMKYGWINANGKAIIGLQYNEAYGFNKHGLALVKENQSYGLINTKGKNVTNFDWYTKPFFTDLDNVSAPVITKNDGKKCVVDFATGKEIIPANYDDIKYVRNNGDTYIHIEKDGQWGFAIDGNIIMHPKYSQIGTFSEGTARVKRDGKYGYINEKGEEIIPVKYDLAGKFNDGFAWVRVEDDYGYINTKGKVVIPISLYYASSLAFGKGLAIDNDGNTFLVQEHNGSLQLTNAD